MAASPYDITLNATVIKQIRSLNHNTGGTVVNAFGSGEASPSAMFQGDSPHSSTMQSTDMGTLLALNTNTFISNGLGVYSATTSVPFRLRANGGEYQSGGVHLAITSSNTFVTPDTISGTQGESATMDCTLRYQSTDGFTSSVSKASSQTLAAATFTGEYLLHSVKINGTAVPELQSVTITPGINVLEQKQGGGPMSAAFFVNERLPIIEITTEDVDTTTALLNAATLGSGVVVYFAKRASGGIIESTASTNHLSITGAAGLRQATTVGGDARANSTGTIRVNPLTLTAATGVAIA